MSEENIIYHKTDPERLNKIIEDAREKRANLYFNTVVDQPVISFAKEVIRAGRTLREKLKIHTKRKIKSCTISFRRGQWDRTFEEALNVLLREKFILQSIQVEFGNIVKDELNIERIIIDEEPWPEDEIEAKINFKTLGVKLGKEMKTFQQMLKLSSQDDLKKLRNEFNENGFIEFNSLHIEYGDVEFVAKKSQKLSENEMYFAENVKITYDLGLSPSIISSTFIREVTAETSARRKKKGLSYDVVVDVVIYSNDQEFCNIINDNIAFVNKETGSNIFVIFDENLQKDDEQDVLIEFGQEHPDILFRVLVKHD